MLMTTTSNLDGQPIRQYLGVVNGEAIIGANLFKDMFASIRNVVGGILAMGVTYAIGRLVGGQLPG